MLLLVEDTKFGEVKKKIYISNANVYFDGGYKIGDQLWQMGPVFISLKRCLFIKRMCYLFELAHIHNLKIDSKKMTSDFIKIIYKYLTMLFLKQ